MAQKVDYQKLQSIKAKIFDANREIQKIREEGTKLIEPYNLAISNLEREIFALGKQIEEEESKIKK